LGFNKEHFTIEDPEKALSHLALNYGKSAKGTDKNQCFCKDCGSVIFGGEYGKEEWHTVYRGTLDQKFRDVFPPTVAMFVKDAPQWGRIPGLKEFDAMPTQ